MSEDIGKKPISRLSAEPPQDRSGHSDGIPEHAPAFPRTVAAAGVLWILAGALPLLSLALTLGVSFYQFHSSPHADGGNLLRDALMFFSFYALSSCCPVLFSVLVLFVGFHTLRGTARGALLNGILSMVVGLPLIYIGICTYPGDPNDVNLRQSTLILDGLAVITGSLFSTAGVLALYGRSTYKLWRQAHKVGLAPAKRAYNPLCK